MAKSRPDFIDVRLSPAGAALAGEGGAIRIAVHHFDYTFTPGAPTNVLLFEWRSVLSKEAVDGQKILEAVAESCGEDISQNDAAAAQETAVQEESAHPDAESEIDAGVADSPAKSRKGSK